MSLSLTTGCWEGGTSAHGGCCCWLIWSWYETSVVESSRCWKLKGQVWKNKYFYVGTYLKFNYKYTFCKHISAFQKRLSVEATHLWGACYMLRSTPCSCHWLLIVFSLGARVALSNISQLLSWHISDIQHGLTNTNKTYLKIFPRMFVLWKLSM